MRYYVDGLIIRAVTDYDSPILDKKKSVVFINDNFDNRATIYFIRRNRIYKQHIFLNDDSTVTVKTKLVHSF